MNGIEKITGRITADTDAQITEILQEAETQAREIRESYQEVAEVDYRATVERGRKDADERVERLGGVARLEAQKVVLTTKQALLDQAFDNAMEQLCALPEEQYVDLLAKLAVDGCETGTEALVLSVKDRPRYGKKVVVAANEKLEKAGKTAQLTLAEEAREFRGGLYVKAGNVENNCTFETILRLLRQTESGEVAKVLFD
jgi:V/A-type H+-transporting ATPase subunit E